LRFRLADLCDDSGLMNSAFVAARTLAAQDKTLSAYPQLRAAVNGMFELGTADIS
jgi:hypothetical protein